MVSVLGADNHYFAMTLDNFTFITHRLYGSSNFHFLSPLILVTVGDTAFRDVIRGHLDFYGVTFQNFDVVHSDFARYRAGNDVTV